ncbi:MAG: squalene synthase HpnC [Betaproteobacteria bacterium HGW-Betaproteobacteria-9]|jgi:squalene synthase HpnC|nr:MAG: squalene synthase HpnC [Betaproteobacteria bacterium HGW-Betaproteobacteria-9]
MTHLPRTAETTTAPLPGAAPLSAGVGHYENFPVASLLCPPALRPAVMAIYHFARTADDIADEGDADATQRLAELAAYRQALQASLTSGEPLPARWNGVFAPLREAIQQNNLPANLLHDLISAFEQDVRHTAAGHHYADTAELLDYCRLSANPVGRLLLHLYGVGDAPSLARSDQICSALQLINFWQDISVDLPRQRHYLPTDLLQRHGLPREAFDASASSDAATQVRMAQAVATLCAQARALMQQGAPLALRIPGRAGWELRLVVQGGLLVLDKIAALQHRSWQQRPRVGALDLPRLLWRALCMR